MARRPSKAERRASWGAAVEPRIQDGSNNMPAITVPRLRVEVAEAEIERLRGIETAARRFWHTYIEPCDGNLLDDADALVHALNASPPHEPRKETPDAE